MIVAYSATYINPAKLMLPAFLGLGFPVILSINIIFLFFWTIKRKFILVYPLISIIVGANHISHFVQFSSNPKEKIEVNLVKDSINVMSYNVRLFDLYNWTQNKETRNKIFKQLDSLQPDIICFQEFYREDANDFITRDTLVKFLNAKYVHEGHTHEMRGGRYFGVATFSKYPIINTQRASFSNDANNNFIITDILKNKDTVRVFNAHIGSIRFQKGDYEYIGGKGNDKFYPWQKIPDSLMEQRILKRLKLAYTKRSEQVTQLRKAIKQSPYPVILCGDFNDIPVSFTYGRLSSVLTDSFTETGSGLGGTYIGYIPGLRIDYIMHSNEFKAVEYFTHKEELSDHRAVSTKLYHLK